MSSTGLLRPRSYAHSLLLSSVSDVKREYRESEEQVAPSVQARQSFVMMMGLMVSGDFRPLLFVMGNPRRVFDVMMHLRSSCRAPGVMSYVGGNFRRGLCSRFNPHYPHRLIRSLV